MSIECDICHMKRTASEVHDFTYYDYSEGTNITITSCNEHEGHIGEDAGYSD